MKTFCTIITPSHQAFARTLYDSLLKQDASVQLQVLVLADDVPSDTNGIRFIPLKELSTDPHFIAIEKKFGATEPDNLRWALKPVLLLHLLTQFDKVIYADPDIYFTGHFHFLFSRLDNHAVLLTPHWADLDMVNNPDSVLSVMKDGLFNAGFVGVNRMGIPAMEAWASLCLFKMERDRENGLYDDQRYLDLIAVQFEHVQILRHQGCNLASWNIQSCKREMIDGQLMINKTHEPIFIHFTKSTILNIMNRNDILLKPYLDDYAATLATYGHDLFKEFEGSKNHFDHPLYRIKHSSRIRTRFKRFLNKLAERL